MKKNKQKQQPPQKNKDTYSKNKKANKPNLKLVYEKKHRDPKTTISKPYKFVIPGDPIFKRKGKITNLVELNHIKLNSIQITMISGVFALDNHVKPTTKLFQSNPKDALPELDFNPPAKPTKAHH